MQQLKIKFIIIVMSISLYGCKKDHFKLADITETDIMGNLVGNVNQNDWKLYNLSQATSFDKNVFNQIKNSSSYDFLSYKTCDSSYNFNFVAYPNPMISDCTLKFKLTTNLSFVSYTRIIVGKDGNVIESELNNIAVSNFADYRVNALKKRDFIFYYIFVTADSCLYYGKGNVIGCTN